MHSINPIFQTVGDLENLSNDEVLELVDDETLGERDIIQLQLLFVRHKFTFIFQCYC